MQSKKVRRDVQIERGDKGVEEIKSMFRKYGLDVDF